MIMTCPPFALLALHWVGSLRAADQGLGSQDPLEKSQVQPWKKGGIEEWNKALLDVVSDLNFWKVFDVLSSRFKINNIKSSNQNHPPKMIWPKITLISGKLVMSNPVAPEHFIFFTHWSSSLAVSIAGRWLNFSYRWPPCSPVAIRKTRSKSSFSASFFLFRVDFLLVARKKAFHGLF